MTSTFKTFVLEQLGRGIAGEQFFALIADDTLYFKVDDSNRTDFVSRGMGPFRPFGEHGEVMQYYRVPDDLLEEAEELCVWAEKSIEVARRAKGRGVRRRGAS